MVNFKATRKTTRYLTLNHKKLFIVIFLIANILLGIAVLSRLKMLRRMFQPLITVLKTGVVPCVKPLTLLHMVANDSRMAASLKSVRTAFIRLNPNLIRWKT